MPSTHKLRCGRMYHCSAHKARWEAEVGSLEARGPASLSYIVVTNKRPCFKHGTRHAWINSQGCPLTPTMGHTWVHRGKKCRKQNGAHTRVNQRQATCRQWSLWKSCIFFFQTDPKVSEEPLLLFIINTLAAWLNLCGCHYWHKKLQGIFKPYKNIPFITERKTQIVSTLNLVEESTPSLVCLLGRFSHTVGPQQTLTVCLERGR